MSTTFRPGVLLDRDGVINPMWYDAEHGIIDSPTHPDHFTLIDGVAEAVRALNRAGLPVAIVSNQPGIAKGKLTPRLLEAITKKMHVGFREAGAQVDGVYYCLHHPEAALDEYRAQCGCRKPRPGLLMAAARDLALDLTRTFMIGDGDTDVRAGRAAGCQTIWIGQMKCDVCQLLHGKDVRPDHVAVGLADAVRIVLRAHHGGGGEEDGTDGRGLQ